MAPLATDSPPTDVCRPLKQKPADLVPTDPHRPEINALVLSTIFHETLAKTPLYLNFGLLHDPAAISKQRYG